MRLVLDPPEPDSNIPPTLDLPDYLATSER
jgi:hypothetical protein